MSFTKVDEREKQAALEEEQARLKALKVTPVVQKRDPQLPPRGVARRCLNERAASPQEQRLKELSKRPSFSTTDTSPISTTGGTISTAPAIDLFSTPSCSNG